MNKLKTLFNTVVVLCASACSGCFQYPSDVYGQVTYTDRHGIHVAENGFGIDQTIFEEEIERVWELWHEAFYEEGVDCYPSLDGTYVSWQGMPFIVNSVPYLGTMEDFGTFGNHELVIRVAYSANIEDTALGHELGHAFLDLCGLHYWEDDLYDWSVNHDVPY